MFGFKKICAVGARSRGLHTSFISKNAVIIDGNQIANDIQQELTSIINILSKNGKRKPSLVALLVGDNPASACYVKRKMKVARAIGIESKTIYLPENTSQQSLLDEINKLNHNKYVDGILVQLPVPKHINEKEICQAVTPKKDVDGFHLENIGNLTLNSSGIIPATALGVIELIKRCNFETFGKNAVVIGRSKHVGLPIALLLHADKSCEPRALDMTTTICHRNTPRSELEKHVKLADLVVSAAGVPNLITKEMIKPGACVIDVGINRISVGDKHKLVGDVDFENVKEVAGYVSPVPGGVGPMTVVMLMKNTICTFLKNEGHMKEVTDLNMNLFQMSN